MKKKILIIAIVFSLIAVSLPMLYGHGWAICGVVVDQQGEPIPGATVVEKGHPSNGATTNLDGAFTMSTSANPYTLKVSCIGYKNFEGQLSGLFPHIVLEEDK